MIKLEYQTWKNAVRDEIDVPTCHFCEGTGKIKCGNCSGDGEVECYACGYLHDCKACQGSGEVDCDKCDGTGKALKFVYEQQQAIDQKRLLKWNQMTEKAST